MKPYVVTLAFGGLLLLGLIYLYGIELPAAERKTADEKRAKQLVSFQVEDVRQMTLQYRGQDAIHLRKQAEGHWWLMKPLHYRADQAEVEDVIRDLVVARVTRVIENPGNDLGDYGLAPPALDVSLKLNDRDERFLIGEKGPVSSQLYFKRGSRPEVYLTNLPDRDILSKTPYVLRRKELLEIDRETIDRLRLEFQTGTFSVSKTGNMWFLDAPVEFLADQDVIGALLFQIENLKAGQFVDDSEEKAVIRARLGVPQIVIYFRAGNIPYRVAFFESSLGTEWIYALTKPDLPVFLVSRSALQKIPSELFQLRDKHLVVVDPSLVTDLAITAQNSRRVFPLEFEGQPTPHPVQEFMRRVLDLRAEIPIRETAEPAYLRALGLDPPALNVTFLGKEGSVLGSLIVSDILSTDDKGQAGSVNAQGGALPGIYGVRSSILVNIPTTLTLEESTATQ